MHTDSFIYRNPWDICNGYMWFIYIGKRDKYILQAYALTSSTYSIWDPSWCIKSVWIYMHLTQLDEKLAAWNASVEREKEWHLGEKPIPCKFIVTVLMVAWNNSFIRPKHVPFGPINSLDIRWLADLTVKKIKRAVDENVFF